MALVVADRVRETTDVVGINDAVLLGAQLGFQAFNVIGNANTTYYTIADQNSGPNWEVGIGTYYASNTTISRDTILSSSSGGNKVDFSSGTKDIFCSLPSSRTVVAPNNANTYYRGDYTWGIPALPIVLNDISTQFDGTKNVFELKMEQDNINTIVDSKDLEVVLSGYRLSPYVDKYTYPWLTPFDSFNGFRVINVPSDTDASIIVGKITIYNAPFIGDSSSLIYRQVTQDRQKRKYPFEAATIALGD